MVHGVDQRLSRPRWLLRLSPSQPRESPHSLTALSRTTEPIITFIIVIVVIIIIIFIVIIILTVWFHRFGLATGSTARFEGQKGRWVDEMDWDWAWGLTL
jgi:hypothetical protein